MQKGIKRRLRAAIDAAQTEMGKHDGGKYARGMASEGYMGGYYTALCDVSLLLDGVEPNDHRNVWKQPAA